MGGAREPRSRSRNRSGSDGYEWVEMGTSGQSVRRPPIPIRAASVAADVDEIDIDALGPIAASQAGRRRFDPGRPLFPESPVPRGFRRLQALGCLGARGEGSGRVPALDAFRSDLGGRLRGPRRFSEGIELGGVHPGVAVPGLDHREGGSDYFAGTGRREPSAECPITLTL